MKDIWTLDHPGDEAMLLLRQWQAEAFGDAVTGALLSYFEYWHGIKVRSLGTAEALNRAAEIHGEAGTQDTTNLQFHTLEQIEARLLGVGKRNKIRASIQCLVDAGIVSKHRNPSDRYKFDRTTYYLFHPEVVQAYLDARKLVKSHRTKKDDGESLFVWSWVEYVRWSSEKGSPSSEKGSAIEETSLKTSLETSEKIQKAAPENFAAVSAAAPEPEAEQADTSPQPQPEKNGSAPGKGAAGDKNSAAPPAPENDGDLLDWILVQLAPLVDDITPRPLRQELAYKPIPWLDLRTRQVDEAFALFVDKQVMKDKPMGLRNAQGYVSDALNSVKRMRKAIALWRDYQAVEARRTANQQQPASAVPVQPAPAPDRSPPPPGLRQAVFASVQQAQAKQAAHAAQAKRPKRTALPNPG